METWKNGFWKWNARSVANEWRCFWFLGRSCREGEGEEEEKEKEEQKEEEEEEQRCETSVGLIFEMIRIR